MDKQLTETEFSPLLKELIALRVFLFDHPHVEPHQDVLIDLCGHMLCDQPKQLYQLAAAEYPTRENPLPHRFDNLTILV
jgi:hypothetical protein